MEISYAKVMTPVGQRLYFRSSVEMDDPRNPEPLSKKWRDWVKDAAEMTVLILFFSWLGDISVAKSSLILILAPGLHILKCCWDVLTGPYYRLHFDMENRELVINRSDGLRQAIPFDELVIRRVDGGDEGVASYFIFLTTKTIQPGDVNIVYPCSTVLASDARSPVEASIISMDIFSMMLVNTGITGENSIKE